MLSAKIYLIKQQVTLYWLSGVQNSEIRILSWNSETAKIR